MAIATALVLVVAALAASLWVERVSGLETAPYEYSIAGWEMRHFGNKWLYGFGALFRDEPSVEEQNAQIARVLDLTRQIDSLEAMTSDAQQRGLPADPVRDQQLAAARDERDRLTPMVEATIEGRVTSVLEDMNTTRSLPLLGSAVWPPVDFELTDSPRTLVTSPRDRIALLDSVPLREDLSLAQIEQIEDDTAAKHDVSAVAFPTGGIGAYPTIVDYTSDYTNLLQTVAHEWTHNYLAFRPLGFHYGKNNDTRSMNETVADLVGHEVAAEVLARWPLMPPQPPSQPPASPPAASAPKVDVNAFLRDLRSQVDALLAEGKVDDAEALMEQRREDLAAQGVFIRKINQAYFAFVNLYAGQAGDPAAVNPIGPKIDELRAKSDSLAAFLRVMGNITTVDALDRALATAGS